MCVRNDVGDVQLLFFSCQNKECVNLACSMQRFLSLLYPLRNQGTQQLLRSQAESDILITVPACIDPPVELTAHCMVRKLEPSHGCFDSLFVYSRCLEKLLRRSSALFSARCVGSNIYCRVYH